MRLRDIIQKMISITLVFLMVFVVISADVMADESHKDELIVLNEQLAIEIANGFAENASELLLEARDPKVYCDREGKASGYLVDYYLNDIRHGYLVLDSKEKNLICEYSFEEDSLSPYHMIFTTNEKYYPLQREYDSHRLFKLDYLTYAIVLPEFDVLLTNLGPIKGIEEAGYSNICSLASSVPSTTWDEIMIDRNVAISDYSVSNENYLNEFIAVSQDEITGITGHFACAVSALFTCSMFLYVPFSYDNYLSIWNCTGTSTTSTSGGVTFGSTPYSNIGPGFVTFCNLNNVYITQFSTSDPSYSFFTDAIDLGKPGVFAAAIRKPNGEEGVHAMAVEGYSTLTNSSGSSLRTLIISDGWYYSARHLLFDSSSMYSKYGVSFW